MENNQQHKNFFNHSVLIFIIRFFPALASLSVLIYLSHALQRDVYGSYQLFWVQFNVLSAFACAGIHLLLLTYSSSTILYIFKHVSGRAIAIFSGWMLTVAIVFGIVVFKVEIPFFICVSLLFLLSFNAIAEAFLVSFRCFKTLAAANFLYSCLFCLLHFCFVYNHWQFKKLFFFILVLVAVKIFFYVVVMFGEIKKSKPVQTHVIHIKRVRMQWLHLAVYDIIQIFSTWIDKIIVGFLLSRELFAIYYNGSINIPFLSLVLGASGSAVLINLTDVHTHEQRKQKSLQLMRQSGSILSSIVFPLFFFLLFFRYELVTILLSDKYLAAVPVFLMTILAVPVRAYSFTTLLQHYHKGHIINIGAGVELLLACLMLYPMYKLIGLPGVAFSFTITTYLQAGYYLYHTSKILQKPAHLLLPLKNWLVKLVICFLIFLGLHHLLVQHFSEQIILILGSTSLALIIFAMLITEIKTGKKNVRS